MRALRRIATPTGIGLAIAGCSLPVDEFQPPNISESRVGNTDANTPDDVAIDTIAADAANDTRDAAPDACECVKPNGSGKCKEWSPPRCGD